MCMMCRLDFLFQNHEVLLKFNTNSQIKKVNISPDESEIIVITTDCKLKVFGISQNEDQVK